MDNPLRPPPSPPVAHILTTWLYCSLTHSVDNPPKTQPPNLLPTLMDKLQHLRMWETHPPRLLFLFPTYSDTAAPIFSEKKKTERRYTPTDISNVDVRLPPAEPPEYVENQQAPDICVCPMETCAT